MSKFTPGPWVVDSYSVDEIEIYPREKNDPICIVQGQYIDGQANARLISKAPEMYELIEKLIKDLRHTSYFTDAYGDAINLLSEIDGEG